MELVDEKTIRYFFHWYRQRLANLKALEGFDAPATDVQAMRSFEPEQHVLIATGLDSLANAWARAYPQPKSQKDGERMGEFLQLHGDSRVFSRVAGPIAFAQALKEERAEWAKAIAEAVKLDPIGGRIRTIGEDPKLDALAAHPAIVNAGIPRDWLRRSRYGEVLYVQFRCYWIHELTSSPRTTSYSILPAFDDFPHYIDTMESGGDSYDALVLSVPFLIKTYATAIESFERRCVADSKHPRVP